MTQRENVIFWMTIAFVPAGFFSGLPKVAVVALLSRLMKPARWLKWTLWVVVVWSVASLAVFMFLQFARCTPTQSMWNFDIQGECMPRGPIIAYAIYANGSCPPPPGPKTIPLLSFKIHCADSSLN